MLFESPNYNNIKYILSMSCSNIFFCSLFCVIGVFNSKILRLGIVNIDCILLLLMSVCYRLWCLVFTFAPLNICVPRYFREITRHIQLSTIPGRSVNLCQQSQTFRHFVITTTCPLNGQREWT